MLLFVGPHDHIWIQVIKSTTGLNIQISVGRGIDIVRPIYTSLL